MKLVYRGVHDAIEIDRPNGVLLIAAHGEPFEIDDETGASLLEQETFTLAKEAKQTPAPAAEKE